jgi:hypothetical protein
MNNLDLRIAIWLAKPHSLKRDCMLIYLIGTKQIFNLDYEGL